MDNKVQAILKAKEKQIDIELEQELIKIGEEYTRRGIPSSGLHLRAKGLAEAKAKAKKEELRATLEVEAESNLIDLELQSKKNVPKLYFGPSDGIASYRRVTHPFKGKGRALLTFLDESKNTPFSTEDIKRYCNPNIVINKYHFNSDKDISDTLRRIRYNLRVKLSEFFPIQKRDSNWIWLQ